MLLTFLHIIPSLFSAPDDLSVSDDMEKGVINSIKIEGVKGEGDYDLSTKEWSVSSSSASYNVPISASGLNVGTGTVNLAPDATLMMIPQKLGDGAKVTINITPTDKSAVDLTFDLKDTQWVAGNHVTYLLSTTKIIKLNMGSVTYPQWQTAEGSAFTSEKLKSSYASGDSLGMYIVDKNHKVVKANVQLTTTDGKNWNFPSLQKFNGSLSYDYFVYYPYQKGGLAGAPREGDPVSVKPGTNQISASDFFSDAITKWGKSLKTDQGDDGKFNSCDLQIGKGELTESSSTVAFPTMTHAMGLAHVKLGKRSITSGVTYISKNDFGPSIDPYTWEGKIAYASSEVDGRKLFPLAKYDYACIVSPGISTEFNTASGVKNAWEKALTFTPSTNKVQVLEALVADTGSGSTEYYTIQLGDIYYNDGSISHDLDETIPDKHYPVGIIVYLAKDNGVGGKLDYWVETNTKNADVGGHALVMCLKTVGSNATSDLGKTFAWSTITNCGRTKYCDPPTIEGSVSYIYGSGYLETEALDNLGKCPAASAAKHYDGLKVSNKSTGWFLPTVGQYLAAIEQLGGGKPLSWNINATFTNSTSIIKNINDALSKVGANKYTYFCQTAAYAWTSTEHPSPGNANYIYTSGASSILIGTGLGKYNYSQQLRVRPFLAF